MGRKLHRPIIVHCIVQSGRQTLENTIQMVESNPDWRARVVYGDTDSLFVLLPGRTREEAFKIGAAIASQATARNPPPVTLKMEKVQCLSFSSSHLMRDPKLFPGPHE